MRYYCPGCWEDFPEDTAKCPACGLDIHQAWKSKDYVQKLIAALSHRQQSTPIRAAWILGKLRERRAVGPLIELVGRTNDVYIATEAVNALEEIDTPEAKAFLETLAGHPARMVREAAGHINVETLEDA